MSEDKASTAGRWPFDPLQPGDHEPVRLPEELERIQKQTGAGSKGHTAEPSKDKP